MARSYSFGAVEVRPDERRRLVDGEPAALGARAVDVLLAHVERRDRVVTKDELLELVWPGVVVEENNLQVQVSTLRKVLGPKALATIPGRGYQFTLSGEDRPGLEPEALAASRSTNIPAPWETLIGRDRDLAALAELLPQARLVTVLGAGGIGKTELAKEAARRQASEHPDGAWWIDLAALSKVEAIAPAIANAANLQLDAGDPAERVPQALSPRRLLLVLDNCEHVAEAVARLAASILKSAPDVRVLATSQVPLKLQGEHVYRLDPLAVPPAGASLEEARAHGAFELLERRAREADRRFAIDASTVQAAIGLCRHLDGIALAIEMAAARVPHMGVAALNAMLGDRLRLLRNANRDVPERHQTLGATLDWSHSLLTDAEKAVLRRLAVFSATFRMDSAQHVASLGGADEWQALDALFALVEKSLVQIERTDPPRYRLLETTRLYALEQLGQCAELEAALQRHGVAMAQLSMEIVAGYGHSADTELIARYAPDYDDLLAALDRACDRRDAATAADIVEALFMIDHTRGDYTRLHRRKRQVYPLAQAASGLPRAKLWSFLAFMRVPLPGMSIIDAAREALAAWKTVGDPRKIYRSLCALAETLGTAGDSRAAQELFAQARAIEDPAWPAQLRMRRAVSEGLVAAYGDDPKAAAGHCQAQISLAQQARSQRFAAGARTVLVEATLNSGDLERALELSRKAVAEARTFGTSLPRTNALCTMCAIALAMGNDELARTAAAEALPHVFRNGVAGWLLDQLGLYAARRGSVREAARLLGAADAAYAAIEQVRRMQDRRGAERARALIEAAIPDEYAGLRAEGAMLEQDEAAALARNVLEVTSA